MGHNVGQLEEIAREIRKEIVRMTGAAGSGHPGGSLSATDLLVVLYDQVLRHRPKEPHWPDRDRFVLSKGHAAPVLYAVLAWHGYFPREELVTLRKFGSPLQGHPDVRRLPGLEASTGSLGQGLSIGAGFALSARLSRVSSRAYVMLSDGETNEGQTWEAARFAGEQRLENLTAILDYNKFQLDGAVETIMGMEPMGDKWQALGWQAREIDGHDLPQILEGYRWALSVKGAPQILIAHTVKGKGVSFMERNNHFHGVAPTPDEVQRALAELESVR